MQTHTLKIYSKKKHFENPNDDDVKMAVEMMMLQFEMMGQNDVFFFTVIVGNNNNNNNNNRMERINF